MFNSLKITAARMAVNNFLQGMGEVGELEIDPGTQRLMAELVLQGEEQPVRIEVQGYALAQGSITLTRFVCSRPWLETALNRFVAGRALRLPDKVMNAVRMVL